MTQQRSSCRPMLLAAFVAATLSAPCALAEIQLVEDESGGSSIPLTLDRSLALAFDNNFSLRRAQAQVAEAAAENQRAARLAPSDPQIEVWTGHRNGLGNSLDANGSSDSSTDVGVRVSQELWIAGQGGLLKQIASSNVDRAQRRLEYLRASIAAHVHAAFLHLLIANEAVATAKQAAELARSIAASAEKRLRAGDGTRLELNSAKIEQGKSEVALSRAELDGLQARVALTELLSLSPRSPISVVGHLSAPSLSLPETAELVDRSIERRQDLAAAADDVIAARESLQLTHRQLISNPSLFGGYATEGKEDVATIGVTFSLPLSIGSNRASASAAQARLSIAEVDQDELRLAVEREVVLGVAAYAAASNQVQLIDKGTLAIAAENVELARSALQAGKIGSPVVAESMATFLETRAAYLAGLVALSQAATDLELATGGLVALESCAELK